MELNDSVIRCMKNGKVFKEAVARVNSIDFHRSEPLLVSASDDDHVRLYEANTGVMKTPFPSKKHGAAHITFTHSPGAVVYASNRGGDHPQAAQHGVQTQEQRHALRYHDLIENKYIYYFTGHTDSVTSTSMCPRNDLLLSAAQDKTVRLWDLRTPVCQAIMHTPGQPVAAFDQQGLVFAVSADSGVIKLYDISQFDKGPFGTFLVDELRNTPLAFSYLRFSQDGRLLLGVVEGRIFVLDAFTGELRARFSNGVPDGGTAPEASFSYDGQYVLSGCEDGAVRVWSTQSMQEVACLQGHPQTPLCCKWAPRQVLFATACQALCFWVPDLQALAQQQHHGQHGQQQHRY